MLLGLGTSEKIRGQPYTDNVVSFMVSQLERLSLRRRKKLWRSSRGVGVRATIPTLTLVIRKARARTSETPSMGMPCGKPTSSMRVRRIAYQFLHDRIREARPMRWFLEAERLGVHLAIEAQSSSPTSSRLPSRNDSSKSSPISVVASAKSPRPTRKTPLRVSLYARDRRPRHRWHSSRQERTSGTHVTCCHPTHGPRVTTLRFHPSPACRMRIPRRRHRRRRPDHENDSGLGAFQDSDWVATYERRLQIHADGRSQLEREAIRAAYEGMRLFGLALPEDDEAIRQETRESKGRSEATRLHVNVATLANLPVAMDSHRNAARSSA